MEFKYNDAILFIFNNGYSFRAAVDGALPTWVWQNEFWTADSCNYNDAFALPISENYSWGRTEITRDKNEAHCVRCVKM
jgi:hypothetical protein